jgi:hypothetical protein
MVRQKHIATLLVAALISCSSATEPTSSPRLDPLSLAMIESVDFEVYDVWVLVDVRDSATQLFRVQYDRPADCGWYCPRPIAYGLVIGPLAGWMMPLNDSVADLFDVLPSHHYLASEEFFGLVRAADGWLFEGYFKHLLAADPDTPVEGLRRITAGLAAWISPWLAGALLDNPQVKADRAMFEVIASLPVYQGDAYREARERAQILLAAAP